MIHLFFPCFFWLASSDISQSNQFYFSPCNSPLFFLTKMPLSFWISSILASQSQSTQTNLQSCRAPAWTPRGGVLPLRIINSESSSDTSIYQQQRSAKGLNRRPRGVVFAPLCASCQCWMHKRSWLNTIRYDMIGQHTPYDIILRSYYEAKQNQGAPCATENTIKNKSMLTYVICILNDLIEHLFGIFSNWGCKIYPP